MSERRHSPMREAAQRAIADQRKALKTFEDAVHEVVLMYEHGQNETIRTASRTGYSNGYGDAREAAERELREMSWLEYRELGKRIAKQKGAKTWRMLLRMLRLA